MKRKNFLTAALIAGVANVILNSAPLSAMEPIDIHDRITPILAQWPEIDEVEICVLTDCQLFENDASFRKGGSADLVYQRPKNDADTGIAHAVGAIVGEASKAVGVGGRIIVDYEQTKNKDGSTKTKVRVEAGFGTGSGAAAGAGSSSTSSSDIK